MRRSPQILTPGGDLEALGTSIFLNSVVVIAKPDALALGRLSSFIEWFSARGFRADFLRLIDKVTEYQLEVIYQSNLRGAPESSMILKWWLYRRAYSISPTRAALIVLSMEGTGDSNGLDSYTYIKSVKGAANPYLGKTGEIRHDLGARVRSMNIIHTCDSPEESFQVFNALLEDQCEREVKRLIQVREGKLDVARNNLKILRTARKFDASASRFLRGINLGTIFLKIFDALIPSHAIKDMYRPDVFGAEEQERFANLSTSIQVRRELDELMIRVLSEEYLAIWRDELNVFSSVTCIEGLLMPNLFDFDDFLSSFRSNSLINGRLNEYELYILYCSMIFREDSGG